MKKYSKFFVAGIILIVFIATFVFLWMKSQPQPVAYEEFTPALKDIRKTTVITGKIEPRNEINIKPQISGIIVKLYKEAGQHVQAGEVIAKVKVIPDESQLSSAQARIRLAVINARQAKIDYDRMKALYNKGLVSGDEYDQKRKALQQADEEVRAANENLEVVRDGVSAENASTSSTLIRSTVSGLILDIPVKVGNTVILSNTFNDGTTIATVADMNDLIFRGTSAATSTRRKWDSWSQACPCASPSVPCRTKSSKPRWNISRPRPPRPTVPTSLRSKLPCTDSARHRSARAIVLRQRSYWHRPTKCSPYPRVPSSSKATTPMYILSMAPARKRPIPRSA